MKTSLTFAGAAILSALFAASLSAQWPRYPEPGVPRTADGKVDVAAPAPKFFDGHPDLSGVWENPGWSEGAAAAGSVSGTGGAPGTRSAENRRPPAPSIAAFFDLGSMVPGGLPYQPWARELRNKRFADGAKDNPDAHCLPLGLMQLHMHPQPRKIIQTPGVIIMLYEAQGGIRQIFTDGRPLPDAKDVQPWWYGYSIGHWEDDTLVVETVGFRDDVWLDIDGSPLTESGRMTERMKRLNYGTLQTDVTIEDPKAYSKPFTVRVTHRLLPDTDLIEFICTENDRSGPHLVGK
jgi:hypothetical protein